MKKCLKKLTAKTPKVVNEGKQLAKQIAKQLPPRQQSTWWKRVKQAAGYIREGASLVRRYGGQALDALDRGLQRAGIADANQWLEDRVADLAENTGYWIGRGALATGALLYGAAQDPANNIQDGAYI